MTYKAPIKDTLFFLTKAGRSSRHRGTARCEHADVETATAIVEECAKLCEGLLAPLNAAGDKNSAVRNAGAVTTTGRFGRAYRSAPAARRRSDWLVPDRFHNADNYVISLGALTKCWPKKLRASWSTR